MNMASRGYSLRCKTPDGTLTVTDLNDESTVIDLKLCLEKLTKLKPENMKILVGYPPKPVTSETDDVKLHEVSIATGDTIILERQIQAPNVESEDDLVSSSSSESQSDEPILNVTNLEEFMCDGIMTRHEVPSDNSCLFSSLDFVISNGELEYAASDSMRKIIANVIASNPNKYTSAYLSMSNSAYCKWILNPSNWGGAIELSILSEFFELEIVVVDSKNFTFLRFGENLNFPRRVFIIYNGVHYDALVMELGMNRQTIFPANDPRPLDMALELAREGESSCQVTDAADFVLQCQTCDSILYGDIEVRSHVINTSHSDFGQL